MPVYTRDQQIAFHDKYGFWHYSAPEDLKNPPKTRTLSERERAAQRQATQSFGDLARIPNDMRYPGSGIATSDSTLLGNIYKPPKPARPTMALQDSIAARMLRGDVEGAKSLKIPPEKSYPAQVRESGLRNLDEGAPLSPAEKEVLGRPDEKKNVRAEHDRDMATYRTIMGKLSALTVAEADPQGMTEEGRKALAMLQMQSGNPEGIRQYRDVLQKQAAVYEKRISDFEKKQTAESEPKELEKFSKKYPPAQYQGRTATDPATGTRYYSDGTAWKKIVKLAK